MAMTLAEAAELSTNSLRRGVMDALLQDAELLRTMALSRAPEHLRQLLLPEPDPVDIDAVVQSAPPEKLTRQQRIKRALEAARVA